MPGGPRVAVLPGDGIGPEVIERALGELPSGVETVRIDAGAQRYLRTGEVLTVEDMAEIGRSDALLLGAVGDPRVEDGVLERGIILELRRKLDLYVNLRPFPDLGIVFVRENTEGSYAGVGERTGDTAVEHSVNTVGAVERCARYAFRLAERRSSRLTWVHKTNVMTVAGGLWREVVQRVSADHPSVSVGYEHADACAYHLVREPSRYDVILTDNLFGDLLSDLAAGVGGGLGKAASANLHPDTRSRPSRCMGLFEPVHGSAPDIAGRGIADPTAAVEAARMMTAALHEEALTG
ncbi:MAG: isocitrate/isopropylmalate dehydrogenase family protein [Actinomycetota bacterium]